MNMKEFYEQVDIITNPATGLDELSVEFDPSVPINPTPCISEYDFFSRIKLNDGKIVIKLYNANPL